VVPSFDASRPEAFAVETVLEGLPHVVVDLDRSRLLPDGHPDPAARSRSPMQQRRRCG